MIGEGLSCTGFFYIHKNYLTAILPGSFTNSCLALLNSFLALKQESFIKLLHFLLYCWKQFLFFVERHSLEISKLLTSTHLDL